MNQVRINPLLVLGLCLGLGGLLLPHPETAMADAPLQAAYDEADITPPLGGSMPGYFQDRQATGVLDPLKAKVLSSARARRRVALVPCDLIGMGAPVARDPRGGARGPAPPARRARLGPLHAHAHRRDAAARGRLHLRRARRSTPSSTRAGRTSLGRPGGRQDAPRRGSRPAALAAEKQAHAARGAGSDGRPLPPLRDEGRHGPHEPRPRQPRRRPRPPGEIDPRVHVAPLRRPNRVLAVIYGLHPDCVGGTQYSADYPHHLTEALRDALGAEWRVLFLNACCGNINHIDVNDPEQKSAARTSRGGSGAKLAGGRAGGAREGGARSPWTGWRRDADAR